MPSRSGARPQLPRVMPTSRRRRQQASPLVTFLRWVGIAIFCIFSFLSAAGLISDGDVPDGNRSQEHYQNETYQVPPADPNPPDLPMPETYEEAEQLMVANPIYDQHALSPVSCEISSIDLSSASPNQIEQHLNDYTACLMQVFSAAIENAGFTAVRPTVTVYDGPVYTACGKMPEYNAAYCGADQQVYYAKNLPDIFPAEYQHVPFVAESILAHEFSHAIQGRTGILISERAYESQMSESNALELSRRTEVQADCWAGQFNMSIQDSVGLSQRDQDKLSVFFAALGDDALTGNPFTEGNHGLGSSRQSWYLTGNRNTNMGACNTFIAPSSSVR